MRNEKRLYLVVLISLLCPMLFVFPARSATIDIAIKAVVGYPLIDNLPAPNTPNHTVWFSVLLFNEGTQDTYCSVSIYLNSSLKWYFSNILIPINGTEEIICHENTTVLGKGVHIISAYASTLGEDNDPSDNYVVGDTVKIGMIADTNYDRKVDMRDVSAVSARMWMNGATLRPIWVPEVDHNMDGKIDGKDLAYYSSILDWYNIERCLIGMWSSGPHGSPEWDWACDLYRDGKIDTRDLAIVCKYYGQVDP